MLVGVLYFSHTTKTQAETSPISSSLNPSAKSSSPISGSSDSQITQDTAFLATLASLTQNKIDTTLFGNDAFTSLKDNEIAIEPVTPGRINPFATIDTPVSGAPATTPVVVTGQPTDVTSTTATLIGTTSPTASSSFFEYGTTATFGKTTQTALTTLVGSFNTKLTGLSPKTTYFYRADSKISGALLYGDTVSFTTN